ARWLVVTDDVDVKMAFARQAGDEAKHFRMIRGRLRALGVPATAYANPLGKGYGPLFNYLDSLKTTVERVAAGQFTREAIARVEHPDIVAPREQQRLDVLAIRSGAGAVGDSVKALHRLREFLFEEEGFGGDGNDYYDPRNSCLNDVLDRRLGIPITLSVLMM